MKQQGKGSLTVARVRSVPPSTQENALRSWYTAGSTVRNFSISQRPKEAVPYRPLKTQQYKYSKVITKLSRRSWIRASWCNCETNQQFATTSIQI